VMKICCLFYGFRLGFWDRKIIKITMENENLKPIIMRRISMAIFFGIVTRAVINIPQESK
jgi:hypothetical protein